MYFEFTKEQQEFREEVEDFAAREIPPGWAEKAIFWPGGYGTMPERDEGAHEAIGGLLRKMRAKGWLSLSWPEKDGGRNSMMKQAIVSDVMSYHRGPIGGVAVAIAGSTIVQVGSEELKQEWLPRIASGEAPFWLGYSEPNAGSDLVPQVGSSCGVSGDAKRR